LKSKREPSFVSRGHRCHSAISMCCVTIVCLLSLPAYPDPRVDLANSALQYGGSVGKLIWTATTNNSAITAAEADRYGQLAVQIKKEIQLGRASSGVARANLDLIATAFVYGAVIDPEPLSKTIAGVAAWGTKKAGDALGDLMLEQTQNTARAVLAKGLQSSGLSMEQLQQMTPDQLQAYVKDLRIGGRKLGEVLADDPKSLAMLQANAVDLATNIGVAALAKQKGTQESVDQIKSDLAKTSRSLEAFQENISNRMDTMTSQLSNLEDATNLLASAQVKLAKQVEADSHAIQTLAQVSYSGWTTDQKLQAVKGGLFPDLSEDQKASLIEALSDAKHRDEIVASIQSTAADLGNIAAIAKNIGLPADVVKGVQGAQILATGVAQFASGNYLGAVASVTSIIGLGGSDADAARYAAMMKYLEQQFEIVNKKLDKIIDLQVETLKALAALSESENRFHEAVLSQLDQIENELFSVKEVAQAILLSQWTDCWTLINSDALNGQFTIPSKVSLKAILSDKSLGISAGHCFATEQGLLVAYVKSGNWGGQIISAENFPSQTIASQPAVERAWRIVKQQQQNAYSSARDFISVRLSDANTHPASYIARFAQPVPNESSSQALTTIFESDVARAAFEGFDCSQDQVIRLALKELLCHGRVPGAPVPPLPGRWTTLLSAPLIGPQSYGVVDTGIVLATVADFGAMDGSNSLQFIPAAEIDSFAAKGMQADMTAALAENKGRKLLGELGYLTEAMVFQQAVAYGDYTTKLLEQTLYDPTSKSLNVDPAIISRDATKAAALDAMRLNPALARNVVLLAIRHAVADSLGSRPAAEAVRYSASYYALGLADLIAPRACAPESHAREKLSSLLPNWQFQYRVTAEQHKQPEFSKCEMETTVASPAGSPVTDSQSLGIGVAVSLSNFYVLVPSPVSLTSGALEQPDSLRLALQYQDRLNQAVIDRNIGITVSGIDSGADSKTPESNRVGVALLDEGWGWQHRAKSIATHTH
jgi:hypothetical protein